MIDSVTDNLTAQQIHQLGINLAINTAKDNNDPIISVQTNNGDIKYYIYMNDSLHEVVFCCSTSKKNGCKINNNISSREYKNRYVNKGMYNDKIYILVHIDLENNIFKFFKISHIDLCMLQYQRDCERNHNNYNIDEWMCKGKGRNNIECDVLTSGGYEVWC